MPRYRGRIGSVQFVPPAPALEVEIAGVSSKETIEALVDSGADSTCIPEALAAELELQPISALLVGGAGSESQTRLVYRAHHIQFEGHRLPNFAVIGMPIEYGILGRDLVNRFIVHFDGPSLQLTIE